jgi:hypothetical protein
VITPAPVIVEPRAEPEPIAPNFKKPWLDKRGVWSVVIGAAVAIVALALATQSPPPGARRAEKDLRTANGKAPEAGVDLFGSPSKQEPLVTENRAEKKTPPADVYTTHGREPESAKDQTRSPRGPRAGDRGQQRSRVSLRK